MEGPNSEAFYGERFTVLLTKHHAWKPISQYVDRRMETQCLFNRPAARGPGMQGPRKTELVVYRQKIAWKTQLQRRDAPELGPREALAAGVCQLSGYKR